MVETRFVTVLDSWIGYNEDAEKNAKITKNQLENCLKKGFVVKFVTSCSLGDAMMIHYVLEKEML